MAGTSSTGSRIRARFARLGVIAVLAALATVLTAGAASAAPDRSSPPDVVPLVDCIRSNADGTWTVVFGYDNRTGASVDIPVGPANKVTPVAYGEPQPTTFVPGVQHGVFSVTVRRGGGPMWHLGRDNLAARRNSGPVCPPTTQLPADGNGTGTAVALGAAGLVGAAVLYRFRRKAARLAEGTPTAGAA
ncbi:MULTISPECIES: hypothetical protein [unclassified Blastococcus]